MKRVTWIDSAKGIGIILVIIGHAGVPEWAKAFIFTFHMPLFFFLSGYLFNYGKYRMRPGSLIRNKFQRLVYPFLFSFLLISLVWFGILTVVNAWAIPYHSPIFNLSPIDCALSLLYGNGASNTPALAPYSLLVDPPLWFLPALFCSILVLFATLKIFSRYGLVTGFLCALMIIGFGEMCGNYVYLPWGLDIACVSLVFTGAGYLTRQWKSNLLFSGRVYLLPVLLFMVLTSNAINGYVDMNTRDYQNIVFFFIGGLAGSFGVCIISEYVGRSRAITRILSYLGFLSLFILVFHVPLMVFCIGPLQIITPGIYALIQGIWLLWFILALCLCLIFWRIVCLVPKIRSFFV